MIIYLEITFNVVILILNIASIPYHLSLKKFPIKKWPI